MVTITDRVFLLGGYDSEKHEPLQNVYSLDCIDCGWRYIGKLLQPRYFFVAMVLPDKNCPTAMTTTTTTQSTTAMAGKPNNLNQATLFVIMILYYVLS